MDDISPTHDGYESAPTDASLQAQVSETTPDIENERPISTAAALLLLGLALEGGEQFATHLRRWERESRVSAPASTRQETAADLRRYAAIGMLRDGRAYLRAMALDFLDVADGIGYEMSFEVAMGVLYAQERWPFSPIWPWITETLADLRQARLTFARRLDDWIADGRSQERQGRQLARQAVASLMDEALDYVAKNPEVRELIEQQSAGMADAAVGTVRERAASADTQIEHLVRSILRRSPDTRR